MERIRNTMLDNIAEKLAAAEDRLMSLQSERDACAVYLKDGETPAQCIERTRRDGDALLRLLQREKKSVISLAEHLHQMLTYADVHGSLNDKIPARALKALADLSRSIRGAKNMAAQYES